MLGCVVAGCLTHAPKADATAEAPARVRAEGGARADAPPLVVAIVVDQLAAEELLRAAPHLPDSGGLRRAIDRGVYYERGRYPYAATLTAPGHASLFTGVTPVEHGVSANERWDYATRTVHPATSNPGSKVIGGSGELGPGALARETVADALVRQRGPGAEILGLSLKDRGAIFPLGRAGTALWYDSATGGFTSSSAYIAALPSWLTDAQRESPVERLLEPWQPLEPALYASVQGPDPAPWEADLPGFGRAFPHDPAKTASPLGTLRFMPALSERLLDFAALAVEQRQFGTDSVPDLLVVSLSGLDYTGHAFGPRSWEYLDHLLRIDRALAAFVERIEARGPATFVLSADHGIAPVPEGLSPPPVVPRVYTQELSRELDAALSERFGAGPWVDACVGAFLYLSRQAKARPDVLDAARAWSAGRPGIAAVFGVEDLRARRATLTNPLELQVAHSLGPDVAADLYLVQAPGTLLDGHAPPGVGTHHGSPYAYDTDVPVIVWGAGVSPRRVAEPTDVLRFAATLAGLLGIEAPEGARGPSLL